MAATQTTEESMVGSRAESPVTMTSAQEDTSDNRSQSSMDEQLHNLARRLTSQSHASTSYKLSPPAPDGPLDPNSEKFQARKWAKAFYNFRNDASGDAPPRTSSIAFRDLNVHGYGTPTDFQESVGNVWLKIATSWRRLFGRGQQRIDILRGLEGVVCPGEMLAVLGPPGSGCSTLLKTIAGDTHGLFVDDNSYINYQGITPEQMRTSFRGEAIYTAETDAHFPRMTAGDTLYFAARLRSPKHIPDNTSRRLYAEHLRDVMMTMFGISHIKNTPVGDDFVRGASGGERKRVTIAEAALCYSPLQCWDNSTRGLDSANALEFCRNLRVQADVLDITSCVSLYQAPQDAYDLFDKILVLYEGRQIFFGKATEAQAYFEGLGFCRPERQTTADFLTSMTSRQERIVRFGWEDKAPRSPDEFAQAWKTSQARQNVAHSIDGYIEKHPFHSEDYDNFLASRLQDQSDAQRKHSPLLLGLSCCCSLTNRPLAILCTIHQPSAMLFQRFDRLLLLAKGGKTVYFGDIGKNSHVLLDYLVRNGAPEPAPPNINPAEYMLEVIGASPGAQSNVDWPAVWRQSLEYKDVQTELQRLASSPSPPSETQSSEDPSAYEEFAARFALQLKTVIKRALRQYWRSPSYIYFKAVLSVGAATFIGLSFLNADNTQSGLQNQMFGVFIFLTIFSQLVNQIMSIFVDQRQLYEARERPAKVYSWKAFLAANMLVEAFYNTIMSVCSFLVWYFPMGLYRNARETGNEHERGAMVFLFVWVFFLFTMSFAFFMMAGLESFEVAGSIVGLLAIMMFTFCGVLAGPDEMPGFWIFMYRVNPFTYFVEGFLGTALANASARCDSNELVSFNAPSGSTCGEYLQDFIDQQGGYVEDPDATGECEFCSIADTNSFLAGVNIEDGNRLRKWGIMWAFVVFNFTVAAAFFWLSRVPKRKKSATSQ